MSVQRFIDSLAREVPPSQTRVLLEESFTSAMRANAVAPAVMGGLLLRLHDGIAAHALDEARTLRRDFPMLSTVVAHLERVTSEELGEQPRQNQPGEHIE